MSGWLKDQRAEANELRKNGEFTDVCFQTHNGGKIKGHKIYLATLPWRYSICLKKNDYAPQNITLEDQSIETEDMEQIFDFIYTENFDFRKYTFKEIIRFHKISNSLMINHLTAHLLKFILNNFEDSFRENALLTWRHFRDNFLKESEDEVLTVILKNIENFLEQNNVLLDHKEYLELLRHRNCILADEKKCNFILEWIDKDEKTRRWYIEDLFKTVNFENLEQETKQRLLKRNDTFLNNKIVQSIDLSLNLR